jgi:cytochrome c2
MTRPWIRWVAAAIVPVMFALTGACGDSGRAAPQIVSGGDPRRGRQLIEHYGCGSCHTIPGIRGARALVGPPLTHWAARSYIAGVLGNTPENLVMWIQHPRQIVPGNDMPELGVSEPEARSIAAYLDQIR